MLQFFYFSINFDLVLHYIDLYKDNKNNYLVPHSLTLRLLTRHSFRGTFFAGRRVHTFIALCLIPKGNVKIYISKCDIH